jgi:hypothetical protein
MPACRPFLEGTTQESAASTFFAARLIFIHPGSSAYNPRRAESFPTFLSGVGSKLLSYPGVHRAMLTPRLLIVGVFSVVCAWLPGSLAAEELGPLAPAGYGLPAGYTLDLFSASPQSNRATARKDSRPVYGNNLISTFPDAVDVTRQPEAHKPETFDLHFAGKGNGGAGWDPVILDDFSAGRKVTVRHPVVAGLNDDSTMPCGNCCPLCQSPLPKAEDAAEYVPEEPAEVKLREGEPAKVLLQAMKQVRPSILDGTIFQDSRPIDDAEAMPLEGEGSAAIIVRCIRNLEAQADRHRLPEGTACVSSSPAPAAPTAVPEASPEAVAALRQAGRDLEETANMLEERGLYDQADHLRAVAQEMRIQARATNASSQSPVSYAPMPMPGPGADGDELAGDKDLERREPQLRYDGDCDDQD